MNANDQKAGGNEKSGASPVPTQPPDAAGKTGSGRGPDAVMALSWMVLAGPFLCLGIESRLALTYSGGIVGAGCGAYLAVSNDASRWAAAGLVLLGTVVGALVGLAKAP